MTKTVLIIEDDKVLAEMYKDKFTLSNFIVITAEDGQKGLDMAMTQQPHLILLDLALPKIKGTDILEMLRSTTWGKTVPIIVLTNLNVDGKILDAITNYNPVYCLLKSNTTPQEVIDKAKEVINHE